VSGISFSTASGRATLSWTDPTESGFEGVDVSWSPNGGEIQRVDAGTETFTATGLTTGFQYDFALRAIYSDGRFAAVQRVDLVVEVSDAEAVSAAIGGLSIGYHGTDSSSAVVNNLRLATTGVNGADITWTSSHPAVVAEDGSVTRPTLSGTDTTVDLTATVSRGAVSEDKQFSLTVTRGLFSNGTPVSYAPSYTKHFAASDIDGDGDNDILIADSSGDELLQIENTDGNGTFGAPTILATGINGAFWVSAADLDGDGDQDVLSASLSDDTIGWYENDGNGGFGSRVAITTAANSATQALAADFDGNGDMDVLAVSTGDDTVEWFENDGTADPSFTSGQVLDATANPPNPDFVIVADVDDDSALDIVLGSSETNEVVWYENNGSGTFGNAQVIVGSLNRPRFIAVGDVNGDGDSDILVSDGNSFDANPDTITWYQADSADPPAFSLGGTISGDAPGVNTALLADVDGDSDLDVVAGRSDFDQSFESGADALVWFENTDGNGSFGSEQIITEDLPGPYYIATNDVDGDGDLDLIANNGREGYSSGIHLIENRSGE
jgi:hypothetical protein